MKPVRSIIVEVTDAPRMNRLARNLDRAARESDNIHPVLLTITSEVNEKVMRPMIAELRVYPPPRDGNEEVDWTSEKQRKKVMAMWRKGKIKLPTDRTGGLGRDWRAWVRIYGSRIRVYIANLNPAAQYVYGKIGMGRSKSVQRSYLKPQQRFHVKTGWKPAFPIVQQGIDKATEMIYGRLKDFYSQVMDKLDNGL